MFNVVKAFWTGSRIIREGVLLEEAPDEAFGDCIVEVEPEDALEEVPEAELAEEAEEPLAPPVVERTWQKPKLKPRLRPFSSILTRSAKELSGRAYPYTRRRNDSTP
jgi:hypothetical protein